MNNTGQEWFFQVPASNTSLHSKLIHEDNINNNVGIGIDATSPQYNLDVSSNLRTSNLWAKNIVALDTLAVDATACNVMANVVATGEVDANIVTASNITACNIAACNILEGFQINASSNLYWGGHSLYEPYPNDQTDWDELIPFRGDTEGMIDVSWLRKPLTAKDVLQDLWGIAETGIDIAEAINDIANWLNPTSTTPQQVLDAIQDALQGMGDESDPDNTQKVSVSWSNLKDRPLAMNNNDLGVKGDIYVSPVQSLKVLNNPLYISPNYMNNQEVTTTSSHTLLDFSTRKASLCNITLSNSTQATIISPSNLSTSNSFQIKDLVITNFNINNTQSNILINGISLSNDGLFSIVKADTHNASAYQAYNAKDGNLSFLGFQTQLKHVNATSCNAYDWIYSRIVMDECNLKWVTRDSYNHNGGINPSEITRFSIDSNGAMYVWSNLIMPSPAIVRGYASADMNNPYREGVIHISPDFLRYNITSNVNSTTYTSTALSINSNGLFLLTSNQCLYGKVENWMGQFARLEYSLCNGFNFGYGLAHDVTKINYMSIDSNSQMWNYNTASNYMMLTINSNAEIVKGNLKIDNSGVLSVQGKPIIEASGAIRRDGGATNGDGFLLSSSGYLKIGKLSFTPDGCMYINNKLFINPTTAFTADTLNQPYNKSPLSL